MTAKRLVGMVCMLALVGAVAIGQEVRLLIVDETTTMEESVRLEALVRGLRATGVFKVRAMLSLPTAPWSDEPFLFVLVFPTQGPYAWLCTSSPVQYLPDPLPLVYAGLVDGVGQAFGTARQVRGSGDDLYPFLLSIYLQQLRVLVGVN